MKSIADLLQRTSEVRGQNVFYRFANGLRIKAEVLHKDDKLRVLPLGNPQSSLMNHVLNFPETVQDKIVFEPFAGSGALGFMALKAGASHVDLLDVNPRALDFQRENAALNKISASRFTSIKSDIADFAPRGKYDLILANPPFVPTPDGIEGTIASNGGSEGSRFIEILVERLEEFLEPNGRALIYVFQFVDRGQPLIRNILAKTLRNRPAELTPSQRRHIPFDVYVKAYSQVFRTASQTIDQWQANLIGRYGNDLTLCHYVLDIGPQSEGPTECAIRDNFAEKFGESFLVPSEDEEKLAVARVAENLVGWEA